MWFPINAQIYSFCILLTSNTGAKAAFLYVYERLLYVNEILIQLFLVIHQYFHAHYLEFPIFFIGDCAGICISCVGKMA
jgi:hypothetical protein